MPVISPIVGARVKSHIEADPILLFEEFVTAVGRFKMLYRAMSFSSVQQSFTPMVLASKTIDLLPWVCILTYVYSI